MERKWELFDKLNECLGGDELALSICKALSMDDMNTCLDYIAREWDIIDESEDNEDD